MLTPYITKQDTQMRKEVLVDKILALVLNILGLKIMLVSQGIIRMYILHLPLYLHMKFVKL